MSDLPSIEQIEQSLGARARPMQIRFAYWLESGKGATEAARLAGYTGRCLSQAAHLMKRKDKTQELRSLIRDYKSDEKIPAPNSNGEPMEATTITSRAEPQHRISMATGVYGYTLQINGRPLGQIRRTELYKVCDEMGIPYDGQQTAESLRRKIETFASMSDREKELARREASNSQLRNQWRGAITAIISNLPPQMNANNKQKAIAELQNALGL